MRGVWLPLSFIPSFLALTAILSNGDGRCPLPFTVDPAGVGAVPGAPEAGEMVVCLDSDGKTNERMKRKNPHSPGLCGEVCHRSAKASRSENLQIEEPVCCG